MEKKSLWLIDGMAIAYRAHFALSKKPIRTASGINTSAIYGLLTTILDLIDTHHPTHIAVAWDTSEPTPRHTIFPQYKAQRQQMPEELSLALDYLHKILPAISLPQLTAPGWEADDIMGTLALRAQERGYQTWLVSSDKDLGQLVNDHVLLYRPCRQGSEAEIWGVAEVCQRWGISRPEQVTDMLGLMGDASDNIPGVPGIGEKTAAKLLAQYPTIEDLIAHAADIPGKTGALIAQHAHQALLSKQLATINCHIPLDIDIATLTPGPPHKDTLAALFTELEFTTIGRRLLGPDFRSGRGYAAKKTQPPSATAPEEQTHPSAQTTTILQKTSDICAQLGQLTGANRLAVALHTEGDDPARHNIRAIALAADDTAVAFPWPQHAHQCQTITEALSRLLERADLLLHGHDIKTTIAFLLWAQVKIGAILRDTHILQALINQDATRHFPYLCERYLGIAPQTLPQQTDLFPAAAPAVGTADAVATTPGERHLHALARDAALCLPLHDALHSLLPDQRMASIYTDIEMPLVPLLAAMEHHGIAIDPAVLRELSAQLTTHIHTLEDDIRRIAAEPALNINSPRQLGTLLFEKLALLEKPPRTKTGQYSTDEATLETLLHAHPIIEKILTHREYTKLKSTYLDALPSAIHPRTGRIHTTFSQVRTATGRLSSEHPNLQNIPIRTDLGRAIRRAFIPSQKNWLLLSADYSQIELRVMAALSADPALIQAFRDNLDIHTATAARIHGIPLEKVTTDMRRDAKTVNFGIIYGISPFGLSQRLGIPRAAAAKLIDDYFAAYPGVKTYMDHAIQKARATGYAETLLGRRRPIPEINSSHATTRAAAERTAINTPIQGTAADMIKLAMIRLDSQLKKNRNPARLLLQVHDELLLEVPRDAVQDAEHILRRAMTDALPLPNAVPIRVDTATGDNWFHAHA
jgi:DNA polymerase-1